MIAFRILRLATTVLCDAPKEINELRLLATPIDRYQPAGDEAADGAIFLFAYGTNPEVVLLIESNANAWSFVAGRLAGASAMTVTLDGDPVWQIGSARYGWSQPYTASNSAADIPGIGPDGEEKTPPIGSVLRGAP